MENSDVASPRTSEKKISDFTDLDAWKHARTLREEVYRVVGDFPSHEKYGLSSQIKRAASSVTANLAEGYVVTLIRKTCNFVGRAEVHSMNFGII